MKINTANAKKKFSLISETRLIELYDAMVNIALLAEILGQKVDEALAAGILLHLTSNDLLLLPPDKQAYRLLKGDKVERILTGAEPQSKHAIVVLPTKLTTIQQLHIALGAAMANKIARPKSATVIYLDGKLARGNEWQSALRQAQELNLGFILVCSGAAYDSSKSTPIEEPGARFEAPGLPPSIQVDAADAVAVYRVAQEALTHAREGSRPTVIRALTAKDLGEANTATPVERMQVYLKTKSLFQSKSRLAAESNFLAKLKILKKQQS